MPVWKQEALCGCLIVSILRRSWFFFFFLGGVRVAFIGGFACWSHDITNVYSPVSYSSVVQLRFQRLFSTAIIPAYNST